MNVKLIAGAVVAALAVVGMGTAAGYFIGYSHCDADNKGRAVEVGQAMAKLGLVINKQQNQYAKVVAGKKQAEQERINAITTNDHQTAKVRALETKLAQILRQETGGPDDDGVLQDTGPGRYHVFDAAAIERVWNDASGNTVSARNITRTVQAKPVEITISRADIEWSCQKWRRYIITTEREYWRI